MNPTTLTRRIAAATLVAATALTGPAATATPILNTTDRVMVQRDWNPCDYEDGQGQRRCIWDAKHAGNGQGQSLQYTHHGSRVKEITHRRAHHLLWRW